MSRALMSLLTLVLIGSLTACTVVMVSVRDTVIGSSKEIREQ